ncbi:hypothetical protein [Stenotrophomonas humi]|uniref:hypothetical protein n=1 Tax=Stenotrophomonas humi TaxID=405444 RepID=UPI003CCCDA63
MKLHLPAMMLGMLLVTSAHATSPIHVEAHGSVRHPGMHTFPADARLSTAALAARPDDSACMLAAALLRAHAIPAQSRLKAGLLFDLDLLAAHPIARQSQLESSLSRWRRATFAYAQPLSAYRRARKSDLGGSSRRMGEIEATQQT